MHLLEELSLWGLNLDRNDLEIPSEFRGQTGLKTLVLEACCINVQALRNILSFPRALVSLSLDHRPEECWEAHVEDDPWTPKAVYEAISQQGASLETLVISQYAGSQEAQGHEHGTQAYESVYYETGGDFDLSNFPKLREYDGFYKDSSGKFNCLPPKRDLMQYAKLVW